MDHANAARGSLDERIDRMREQIVVLYDEGTPEVQKMLASIGLRFEVACAGVGKLDRLPTSGMPGVAY